MEAILNAYASEDENGDGDEDEDDDDAAVIGPARARTTTNAAKGVYDAEDALIARSAALVGPASVTTETVDEIFAWVDEFTKKAPSDPGNSWPSSPDVYVRRVKIPPEPAKQETTASISRQCKVLKLFVQSRECRLTPNQVLFSTSAFRNPDYLQRWAQRSLGGETHASGMPLAFCETPAKSSDYYQSLASDQRAATKKYFAERDEIAFTPGHQAELRTTAEAAKNAATFAVAIAKANAEARIAMTKR